MTNYVIFDTLVEGANRAPFDAVKTLLARLNIQATSLAGTKSDPGFDSKTLNTKAYQAIFENALTKADEAKATIIALENSSYLGLLDAKQATQSAVEIIDANTLIVQIIGEENLAKAIKHPFTAFNAGIHYGSEAVEQKALSTLLNIVGAKEVALNRAFHDNGYSIQRVDKEIAFKMAGAIMLDVFDTACDFVIVNDIRSFTMFDTQQKKLARTVGRDIGLAGLPVLSMAQVLLMALGEITPSANHTDKHAIKPTFL